MLLDRFEKSYGQKGVKRGEITFDTKTAMSHSQALKEAPRIIEVVKAWLEKWEREEKGVGIASSG